MSTSPLQTSPLQTSPLQTSPLQKGVPMSEHARSHRARSHRRQLVALGVAAGAVVAMVSVGGGAAPAVAQDPPPRTGIACTTGPTFDLATSAGHIALPDGNTVYMYGYNVVGQPFQHPGPVLCVNEGDTVTVALHNNLKRDTSIIFPGQENVLANGAPAQPVIAGTGDVTSLTNMAAKSGGTMTYSFVADHPGTFIYESGTDTDMQVHMGLFGTIIVRPSMGADHAYNRTDDQFLAKDEFMVLLSEIDPYLNQAIENGDAKSVVTLGTKFNMNNFHPRYWLVNGRGFPDSIADNYASWLPNQPYGALARIKENESALARYINVGTEEFPFHPHANNGTIIGRDGNPLQSTSGQDTSYEKYAINIGPGQTYDVLFSWHDAEQYSEANPVPVAVPQVANQVFGMFYSGSPYLGVQGPQPPGSQTLNQCGEYYIISHNHALYQITSWGVNMTGPITYMRIDPPDSSNCP